MAVIAVSSCKVVHASQVVNANPAVYALEVRIIISPSCLCYCALHETEEMQTGICVITHKEGFVVQRCNGGTPVQGQTPNISYDVPKPVISYLLFISYWLTDH